MPTRKQQQFMDTDTDNENIETITDTESKESNTVEVDLDALGFDHARDEVEKRKLDAPAGDWKKEEEWEFSPAKNVMIYGGDCETGDTLATGRLVYSFYGRPTARLDKEGNEFQPFLRFRISPDKRYSVTKPDQVDQSYKLFLRAKTVFFEIEGRAPKSQSELVRFFAEGSYLLTTMRGDDGPFVLNIKAPRIKAPGKQ